jgi:HD-like signal output (HDOD) protein
MNAANQPLQPGTLKRLLAGHPYFSHWDNARFLAVAPHSHLLELSDGQQLLELGGISPFSSFLLTGQLALTPESGESRSISAGELDAGFPIANLRPSAYQVLASQPSRILQIESSQLKSAQPQGSARFQLPEKVSAGSWQAHPLVTDLARQIRNNSLQIPPLPGIAVKVRRALARDDVEMADVATIISADPAIAGRLIAVANSAVFGAASNVDSVQGALVRMGLNRAQNIVISLATRNLYVTREPLIKAQLLSCWRHAIDIAALAAVLGELTPGLDEGVGMLIGLLHEIGAVPILLAAREYPDLVATPGVLSDILQGMAPTVSQKILTDWDFADAFIHAALEAENWWHEHDGDADFTDVLIVAHLHALVKERAFKRLPRIDETPAFQKLALGQLGPKLSLAVLDKAKAQIAELRSLLS